MGASWPALGPAPRRLGPEDECRDVERQDEKREEKPAALEADRQRRAEAADE